MGSVSNYLKSKNKRKQLPTPIPRKTNRHLVPKINFYKLLYKLAVFENTIDVKKPPNDLNRAP